MQQLVPLQQSFFAFANDGTVSSEKTKSTPKSDRVMRFTTVLLFDFKVNAIYEMTMLVTLDCLTRKRSRIAFFLNPENPVFQM